jgi:hypothetical protein
MLPLHEMQQRFGAALFDGDDARIARHVVANGIAPAARIDIYRNNLQVGFRKALALMFPVIEQLVGEAYFSRLSRDYQAAFPSRSGDLHHIGRSLPLFLRAQVPAGDYAYLADVAELEWAIQEIAVAARPAAATVDDLRPIEPEAYDALRLGLHPAARLVASAFPVVRIWMSNQPGATAELVHLDAGGDRVLVRENEAGLEFHRLRAGEYALVAALAAGLSLGTAAERALASGDPQFDLVRALHRLLSAEALVLQA